MKNLTKEEFLEESIKFIKYFKSNWKAKEDTKIIIHSGDNSVICNPNSEFYELFAGHSIRGVAEFVAKELNQKIEYID